MTSVMPEGWTPQVRGRKPLVDPAPVFRKVKRNKGRWVVFNQYDLKQCQSLDRQLTKMGCLTSVAQSRNGKPRLYAQWEDKQ